MKKFFTIFMVAFFMFALAACNANNGEEATVDTMVEDTVIVDECVDTIPVDTVIVDVCE